jgi:hypothetical protein
MVEMVEKVTVEVEVEVEVDLSSEADFQVLGVCALLGPLQTSCVQCPRLFAKALEML